MMQKTGSPFLYLPKSQPILTSELSKAKYHPRHIHMHDHTELLFITTEAECEIINSGEKQTIKTPALIIHRAGTYHGTDTIKTGPDGYSSFAIHFVWSLMANLPASLIRKDILFSDDCVIISMNETQLAGFQKYLDLMRYEAGHTEKLLLLLLIILADAAVLAGKGSIKLNARNNYIFNVFKYIVENFDKKISCGELARMYHVSISKLNADFRRVTDITIKDFYIRIRLGRAVDMLLQPGTQIASVSYACGFSSESYFIQSFQKNLGMTPKQYILQHKSNYS